MAYTTEILNRANKNKSSAAILSFLGSLRFFYFSDVAQTLVCDPRRGRKLKFALLFCATSLLWCYKEGYRVYRCASEYADAAVNIIERGLIIAPF